MTSRELTELCAIKAVLNTIANQEPAESRFCTEDPILPPTGPGTYTSVDGACGPFVTLQEFLDACAADCEVTYVEPSSDPSTCATLTFPGDITTGGTFDGAGCTGETYPEWKACLESAGCVVAETVTPGLVESVAADFSGSESQLVGNSPTGTHTNGNDYWVAAVGDVYLFEDVFVGPDGTTYDLTRTIVEINGMTGTALDGGPEQVRIYENGGTQLWGSDAGQDEAVVWTDSIVENGSATPTDPTGVPVTQSLLRVTLRDIDSDSAAAFSEVGGLSSAGSGSTVVGADLASGGFTNGYTPATSVDMWRLAGSPGSWLGQGNTTATDTAHWVTREYSGESGYTRLIGVTGSSPGQGPTNGSSGGQIIEIEMAGADETTLTIECPGADADFDFTWTPAGSAEASVVDMPEVDCSTPIDGTLTTSCPSSLFAGWVFTPDGGEPETFSPTEIVCDECKCHAPTELLLADILQAVTRPQVVHREICVLTDTGERVHVVWFGAVDPTTLGVVAERYQHVDGSVLDAGSVVSEIDCCGKLASLGLEKVPSGPGPFLPGDVITYTFTVTNTGEVPLTVTVDDPTIGVTGLAVTPDPVPVGGTGTATVDHIVTDAEGIAGSIDNTATASGTGPDGETASSDATASVLTACPPFQTGTWDVAGDTTTDQTTGIEVEFAHGPGAEVTYSPNGAMNPLGTWWTEPLAGDTSLQLVYFWDTTPETGLTDIDLPGDDQAPATVTFTFPAPVDNPVLHFDRIGGQGGLISNTSVWTLQDPYAISKLAGTDDFMVVGDQVYREPDVTTTGSGESFQDLNTGTAGGSVQVTGENITSLTFVVTAAGVEGVGADGVEIIVTGEGCF